MASIINSPFLDAFPKIKYDINRAQYPVYETVTNVFFRFGILRNIVENVGAYYFYDIEDGETPEILAEKVYQDSGAGWIIVYANEIADPQFDWPLDSRSFIKYIIGKYGSVENAQTQVHHYEKIISRFNTNGEVTTTERIWIDGDRLSWAAPDVPYDTYQNVAATTNIYTVAGHTVTETISKAIVSAYDYEMELNDAKRTIRVIKADYYKMIMNQFADLTSTKPEYIRRIV